jgi:5-oxoprolinase (ATP-hydrolysing) subunit A
MTIDLNCDMGERFGSEITGNDEAIMPFISSANIACGFHGGDPVTIEKTIKLAIRHGVNIGAHPGYADKEGFGRKQIQISHEELRASILYQVGALKSMTEVLGGRLTHVKPHGAMYNSAAVDFEMASVIAETIKEIDRRLILFCLSGSEMISAAKKIGLPYASEVFADRAYNNEGTLVPRSHSGAVIHDTEEMIARALQMIHNRRVKTISGEVIPLEVDTICIHGDNSSAADFVKSLTFKLKSEGIEMKPFNKK